MCEGGSGDRKQVSTPAQSSPFSNPSNSLTPTAIHLPTPPSHNSRQVHRVKLSCSGLNRTLYRQRLAAVTMFLRNCVVLALSRRDGLRRSLHASA